MVKQKQADLRLVRKRRPARPSLRNVFVPWSSAEYFVVHRIRIPVLIQFQFISYFLYSDKITAWRQCACIASCWQCLLVVY